MNQFLWSSSDPVSIPLNIRNDYRSRGNLVQNPSFSFFESALNVPFWTLSGDGVLAVSDRERPHVLKIVHETSSEIDDLSGALSDFISVIPGNYDLTCSMRFENIKSNTWRLGTKVHDAVEVRIKFYDSDYVEIQSIQRHPCFGVSLDNGLKIIQFSNEWELHSKDWMEIRCRSAHYPYSDGDIPDKASYIRVYVGLRGTGTLYIDDVSFIFSRWNFSAKERLSSLLDIERDVLDLLIPEPKQSKRKRIINCLDSEGKAPIIQIMETDGYHKKNLLSIAERLRKRLDAVCTCSSFTMATSVIQSNVENNTQGDINRLKIILAFTDLRLPERFRNEPELQKDILVIQKKPEAYVMRFFDEWNTILLLGEDLQGIAWATITLIRLLNKSSASILAANIVDWPDFLERPWILHSWKNEDELERDLDILDTMVDLKLNTTYLPSPVNEKTNEWWNPDNYYDVGITKIGEKIDSEGIIKLGAMIHPYIQFKLEEKVSEIDEARLKLWNHSSEVSHKNSLNVIEKTIDAGANSIMLMSDDLVPHQGNNRKEYSLWDAHDNETFINLQNAQANMINRVYQYMKSRNPQSQLEFCPPYYLNEFIDKANGMAECYFRDLRAQIPTDVPFIWCGGTVRSLMIDELEIQRFTQITGSKPVFWDNTLYARTVVTANGGYTMFYPGKVRMCNLIEAYDIQVPKNFYNYLYQNRIFTNATAFTETYQIKYSTVADMEWNFEEYDPDKSLAKVLVSMYGKEAAHAIVDFNDYYFFLVDERMRNERNQTGTSNTQKITDMITELRGMLLYLRKMLPVSSMLATEFETELNKQEVLCMEKKVINHAE